MSLSKLSAFKTRLTAGARALGRDTGALIAAAPLTLALYAAALLLPPELATRLGPEWLARLGNLFGTLALTPLFTARVYSAMVPASVTAVVSAPLIFRKVGIL